MADIKANNTGHTENAMAYLAIQQNILEQTKIKISEEDDISTGEEKL